MEPNSGAIRAVDSINRGFEIIKEGYWTYVGMCLVAWIIIIVIGVVFGMINGAIGTFLSAAFGLGVGSAGGTAGMAAAIAPQVITQVIGILFNIVVLTIVGVLGCGIYNAMANDEQSGVADFGLLFSGFPKVMQCLAYAVIGSLVQFIIGMVVLIIGAAVGVGAIFGGIMQPGREPDPSALGAIFIGIFAVLGVMMLLNIIYNLLTTFVYPIIADTEVSGIEAVLLSAKGAFRNLGGLILLQILLGLMMIGGTLLCLIGLIFVVPILYAANYAAFRSVFPSERQLRNEMPPPPPTWNSPVSNQPGY